MYKFNDDNQISFLDFNQSCGMQLDPENEWVKLADRIPWDRAEQMYAVMFPSATGRPAAPLRMALGSLIIKQRKDVSDRKLLKEIQESPYLQYFIGLKRFQHEAPFTAPALVSFRKRINIDFLITVNDMILEESGATNEHNPQNENARAKKAAKESDENGNLGTTIIDASVSPMNIRYPQDFSLTNEARVKLEAMIDRLHKTYQPWKKPRTYRRVARKEYLDLSKSKKKTTKSVRTYLRRDLERLRRDMGYIEKYREAGYNLTDKELAMYETIQELYRQQKYMYDNKTHQVENRIVSLSQPYIRPIVRGKAKARTEFGPKYDVSIDEKGHARLEKISFDPYNESTIFQDVIERYHQRTGHYPNRVLVDQIYRTRNNLAYCKEHQIEVSGPKLGRKPAGKTGPTKDEKQDCRDRNEVERFFSLDKRCNGAGLIKMKLEETALNTIALTVLVTNLFATPVAVFFVVYFMDAPNQLESIHYLEIEPVA